MRSGPTGPAPTSPLTDLNRRPLPYHGSALPTELRGRSPTSLARRHARTGGWVAYRHARAGAPHVPNPPRRAPRRRCAARDLQRRGARIDGDVRSSAPDARRAARRGSTSIRAGTRRSSPIDATARSVGFASLSPYRPRPAYSTDGRGLDLRAARPARPGVGRLLLGDLVDLARDHGFHSVIGRIVGDHDASIALHARLRIRAGRPRARGRPQVQPLARRRAHAEDVVIAVRRRGSLVAGARARRLARADGVLARRSGRQGCFDRRRPRRRPRRPRRRPSSATGCFDSSAAGILRAARASTTSPPPGTVTDDGAPRPARHRLVRSDHDSRCARSSPPRPRRSRDPGEPITLVVDDDARHGGRAVDRRSHVLRPQRNRQLRQLQPAGQRDPRVQLRPERAAQHVAPLHPTPRHPSVSKSITESVANSPEFLRRSAY